MKIVILDKDTLGDDISYAEVEKCGDVVAYPTSSEKEVLERICDAEVVIINKIKISKEVLEYAKKLRLVCVAATGYDNIDIDACREKGVGVCNVVGYSTHSVAQLTLALVLALSVNLANFTEYVESGKYSDSGVANKLTPVYHELCGKTWGIIGYGNIGRQVGKIATAMGCKVIANKKTPCDDAVCVDIEELCKSSDIITIHTPLTDSTRNLINKETLAMMKENVILVNTSRGAVTDEEAVCQALEEDRIGGFATDVYSKEPFPKSHPYSRIMGRKNVYLTPHMAWGSFEARSRCINEVAMNIKAFFNNEKRGRVDL